MRYLTVESPPSAAPAFPADTIAYSISGPTASAKFVGSVHGVVVQANMRVLS